jgi:hypothetical protein
VVSIIEMVLSILLLIFLLKHQADELRNYINTLHVINKAEF